MLGLFCVFGERVSVQLCLGTCYVDQAGLQVSGICLTLPIECWVYRHVHSSCLAKHTHTRRYWGFWLKKSLNLIFPLSSPSLARPCSLGAPMEALIDPGCLVTPFPFLAVSFFFKKKDLLILSQLICLLVCLCIMYMPGTWRGQKVAMGTP